VQAVCFFLAILRNLTPRVSNLKEVRASLLEEGVRERFSESKTSEKSIVSRGVQSASACVYKQKSDFDISSFGSSGS